MSAHLSQPWSWLSRRKKDLGVGFSDMIHSGPRSRRRAVPRGSDWQEIFLPLPKVPHEETKLSPWLGVIFGLSVAVIGIVFIGRLWQLQIARGSSNLLASEGNRVRIRVLPAPRGVIYDRQGFVLANNSPGFRLVAETIGVSSLRLDQIADFLSGTLPHSSAEIRSKLDLASKKEAVLQSGLTRDQALVLEVQTREYPEVHIVEEPIRNYPNGEVLAHLIGYLGEIGPGELQEPRYSSLSSGAKIGRSGIEQSYDYLLRGRDGRELVEVDSLGRTERIVAKEDPIPGRNLVLTIDLNLTKSLASELKKQILTAHSEKGALVGLNPQDGSVLAYVSYPSFDPNLFSRGISTADYQKLSSDPNEPLFDRVISGTYPPGSTFKPTVATAALSSGVTTKTRLIESPGVIYLGTQAFHNWRLSGFGQQSIVDAIAYSNDVYFYYMGAELGVDRLSDWASKFGLGQKTGINLPGEATGNVPTSRWKEQTFHEPWYPGENYNYGIGQGYLLVSPVQLASDIAAISNGGKLYQPILIKEVRDSTNLVVSHDNPILRRSGLAEGEVLNTVKEGMRKACTLFVNLAGDDGCKTGSAEFGGSEQNSHAWFVTFAPWDKPEVALAILIEGGGHGSIVSAPVARPALEKYLAK